MFFYCSLFLFTSHTIFFDKRKQWLKLVIASSNEVQVLHPVFLLIFLESMSHNLIVQDGIAECTTDDILSPEFVPCVFSLLYGCCVFPTDERRMLQVLSHLVRIQLATCESPRLLLRKGTAAFCRLYKLFSEGLFTAKVSF